MCKYCEGETVKERVEYTTKAERKAHGGSWFGYKKYIEHPHFPDADNVWIEGNTLFCESFTEYDGRTIDTTTKLQINYCPMCGKKMN